MVIKKTFLTILAFFYLFVSMGANVQVHYCMNKFSGWKLGRTKTNSRCGRCGMKTTSQKRGCCKDIHKFIKIEKDQKLAGNFSQQVFQSIVLLPVSTPAHTFYVHIADNNYSFSHGPPPRCLVSAYILHCVFRI